MSTTQMRSEDETAGPSTGESPQDLQGVLERLFLATETMAGEVAASQSLFYSFAYGNPQLSTQEVIILYNQAMTTITNKVVTEVASLREFLNLNDISNTKDTND